MPEKFIMKARLEVCGKLQYPLIGKEKKPTFKPKPGEMLFMSSDICLEVF